LEHSWQSKTALRSRVRYTQQTHPGEPGGINGGGGASFPGHRYGKPGAGIASDNADVIAAFLPSSSSKKESMKH
jgi:hypothetical protein